MADIKQISIGNDVYDIKDSTARTSLSSKQDKLTPVSPITIAQETISPTTRYSIVGTTATPIYTSYSIGDYYGTLTFTYNGSSTTPTTFSEWCNQGSVGWIDIPVDFSTSIQTISLSGSCTDKNQGPCLAFGVKSGDTFDIKYLMNAWQDSTGGGSYDMLFYYINSVSSTGQGEINLSTNRLIRSEYQTRTTTSESNSYTLTLTDNTSSIGVSAHLVSETNDFRGTASANIDATKRAALLSVNCIRVFIKASVTTTTTTYGSSWNLADGATTNNNISVSYDDTTITKNSNDELQAVKLVGLTSTVSELNYCDGVTSAIQTQIDGKQAELVSGTNIKTINSTSLLGSGDIEVATLPSRTGHTDSVLGTNGTTDSWKNLATCHVVIDTYINGTSGYRIWDDGYCEQWGQANNTATGATYTLTKSYQDTNYNVQMQSIAGSYGSACNTGSITKTNASSFVHYHYSDTTQSWMWRASGYLADGEY